MKDREARHVPRLGFLKDPTGVAALYLGRYEGGELVYMGKDGTGWTRTVSSRMRKQLSTVLSPQSPAHQAPPETEGDMDR